MFLLDTNVVSELRKVRQGRADANVAQWSDSVDATQLYVSVVSLQELELGVLLAGRRDTAQGAVLRARLNAQVLPAFAGRILSVDAAVALRCAVLNLPDPRPAMDSLIAATALVHGMTLVTRITADFQVPRPAALIPWQAAASLPDTAALPHELGPLPCLAVRRRFQLRGGSGSLCSKPEQRLPTAYSKLYEEMKDVNCAKRLRRARFAV